MKRREFIALVSGAVAAWPLAARAQPSERVYRIGFLGVTSHAEYAAQVDGLRRGLSQLGYEEGKNIVIEYRWAEDQYDRLPELAAELVSLNVHVIVTHSTPGTLAAKQAASSIPVVFAVVADPVESGLVTSLHRPGGNLTGLTFSSLKSAPSVSSLSRRPSQPWLGSPFCSILPILQCSHCLRACSALPVRWAWNLCTWR